MPFFDFDPEVSARSGEIVGVSPDHKPTAAAAEGYTYFPVEGFIKPAQYNGLMKDIYDALLSLDVLSFRGTYYGGYDEGFAHFVSATTAEGTLSARKIVGSIKDAFGDHFGPFRADVARELDWLVEYISLDYLGFSLGPVEYAIYGAFDVDLTTGKITDDPEFDKPTTWIR